MPWLAPFENAPDTHRMWADPGSSLEAALRASGYRHEVPAPGSEPPVEQPPAEPRPEESSPVVERTVPERKLKPKGPRRAAVGRKP